MPWGDSPFTNLNKEHRMGKAIYLSDLSDTDREYYDELNDRIDYLHELGKPICVIAKSGNNELVYPLEATSWSRLDITRNKLTFVTDALVKGDADGIHSAQLFGEDALRTANYFRERTVAEWMSARESAQSAQKTLRARGWDCLFVLGPEDEDEGL